MINKQVVRTKKTDKQVSILKNEGAEHHFLALKNAKATIFFSSLMLLIFQPCERHLNVALIPAVLSVELTQSSHEKWTL